MRTSRLLALLVALVLFAAGPAAAHPDEESDGALHDNRHALHDASHESESEGHIEMDVNYGLRPVGHDELGGVEEGRYTDVWSDGRGYAYVGTFQEPTCDRSGVYISDISDPANPATVTMVKSAPGTRVNDVKTITMPDGRVVLIHTEEPCGLLTPGGVQQGFGGISLWDVTNPERPHPLKQHFLDFPVHNTYPWHDESSGNTYLIGVNDIELRDVFIADITKPQSPELLAEVGLPDWPGAQDGQSAGMGSFAFSFNHDVWVANTGTESSPDFQAVVSYWDAGFVLLDVNDPANPSFIDDSTYPDPDPLTGFSPPEGNAHAAVFDAVDASWIFAGDEDFDPFRTTLSILGGGDFPASEGAFTRPIADLEDQSMNGSTTYVGLACGESIPLAVEDSNDLTDEIAVVQRGVCTFQLKAETVLAAGYDGFVVFNDAARGDSLVTMGGDGIEIPGVFVGHSTGLAIFGVSSVDALTVGDTGSPIVVGQVFDGWGYFHLLDSELNEEGYYAPGQVNDADYATGFGDLTMHNVEGDPETAERAFIAWYSLGMRVIEVGTGADISPPGDDWDAATPGVDDYYGSNVTEVGRWIAPSGSNFWGVHVTDVDGNQYVLGSDRNTGLHIFQFDPEYCVPAGGLTCP